MFGSPPLEIPENLAARDYFALGTWYEELRQRTLARRAYERVIELAPGDAQALEAKRIVESRLNSIEVPQSVVDSLFRAELQIAFRPTQSKDLVEKVLQDYPMYDLAHRLLAQLHLNAGAIHECLKETETTLSINPSNIEALTLMARVQAVEFNYPIAFDYVRKALALSPENEELRLLRRSIESLMAVEDEICPVEEQVHVLYKRLRGLTSKTFSQ
ncbi:MAG TPA: hypothetical protein V6C97_25050 [Oculatellaceae cyanobacterium]